MKKESCSTQVQFTVNLADLKRSSRRLVTRLSDESEAGGEFVVFAKLLCQVRQMTALRSVRRKQPSFALSFSAHA
jgi:hypothetical protein